MEIAAVRAAVAVAAFDDAAADAAAAVDAAATLPLGGGKELLLMRDWNVVDRVAIKTEAVFVFRLLFSFQFDLRFLVFKFSPSF